MAFQLIHHTDVKISTLKITLLFFLFFRCGEEGGIMIFIDITTHF